MSDGSNYLDPNRPDAVRLSVSDARARGEIAVCVGSAWIVLYGYQQLRCRFVEQVLDEIGHAHRG